MKLEFLQTQVQYAIPVPVESFLFLLRREWDDWQEKYPPLYKELKIDGVSKVEYDGRFDAYIFVLIDSDRDNADTKKQIADIINKHLARAKRYSKTKNYQSKYPRQNAG